jgi:hypothetical protein
MPQLIFTSTTNWIVPNGVNLVTFECWGAGGGGGGAASGTNNAGSGGGGGAYSIKTISVNPGIIYDLIIPAGGAGGSALGGNGTAPGSTQVFLFGGLNAICTANSGLGGIGGINGASSPGVGTFQFPSGIYGVGDIVYSGGTSGYSVPNNFSGGGGGGAGSNGPGGSSPSVVTSAAQSFGLGTAENGGNGAQGVATSGNGTNGLLFGGGGSGGIFRSGGSGRIGGTGAQGLIRVTYSTVSQTQPVFISWIDESDY